MRDTVQAHVTCNNTPHILQRVVVAAHPAQGLAVQSAQRCWCCLETCAQTAGNEALMLVAQVVWAHTCAITGIGIH